MKSKIKKIIIIVLLVALPLVGFNVGMLIGQMNSKLSLIENIVKERFALEYDSEYMEDMAAKFMIMALEDPYSAYYTREEGNALLEQISGSYKGIGITINYDADNNRAEIMEVMQGTPAYEAGVEKGDILLSVDGREITLESYNDLVYYIKGISDDAPDDDTEMEFEFMRDGEKYTAKLKRSVFKTETVTKEKLEGPLLDDICYIRLTEFSDESAKDFEEAINNIEDEKGIILDLRDNGGGVDTALLAVAEKILPKGILYYSVDAKGARTNYEIKDDEYNSLPLVVLVNENTASASEVLTAAIKEGNRGKIIGETTYGKGLIQGIMPLPDGSMLKLTVAKYYTPNGEYINEIGITPDIVIEDEDKQLEAAIEELRK